MRLLKLNTDGSFSPTSFSDRVPPYAILSHTWGSGEDDEVTFQDIRDGTGNNKTGFQKLQFCASQAKDNDLHYFWVDTCCINKTDLNELTAAIHYMFRWYRGAARCYVYLSDVSVRTRDGQSIYAEWESAFRNSRWFKRGWTLQELLAPKVVDFFSRDGVWLGDRSSLEQPIAKITRISIEALHGQALSGFSIEERFSWAQERQTTKEEDKAYCLLGIFDISLPLIYGEGAESAMHRLSSEIRNVSEVRLAVLRLPLTYYPIKNSEVRIFILSPGNEGTEIIAKIKLFNLQDPELPKYDALSYVWGQEPAIHPIDVDNKMLRI